jgi:hypothetical protein
MGERKGKKEPLQNEVVLTTVDYLRLNSRKLKINVKS